MMKVLLGVVLGGILLAGGCALLLGGAANEVDKAITENAERPGGTDNPLAIEEGKAFEIDGMNVAGG